MAVGPVRMVSGFTVTELGLKVSIKYLNCKPVSHSHFLFQLVLRKFHSVCISFSGFLPCGFSCELADLSFILWVWFIAQQPKRNCIYIFFHKATYIWEKTFKWHWNRNLVLHKCCATFFRPWDRSAAVWEGCWKAGCSRNSLVKAMEK